MQHKIHVRSISGENPYTKKRPDDCYTKKCKTGNHYGWCETARLESITELKMYLERVKYPLIVHTAKHDSVLAKQGFTLVINIYDDYME